jgi:diaminopimelate epimerase
MHGIGNDFMIIDGRESLPKLSTGLIKMLANRNLGVGFDQLAVIYKAETPNTAGHLKFWNSDGSVSATCGNASRCIAKMLIEEKNVTELNLETDSEILKCEINEAGVISINMGIPKFLWSEIPLAIECETLHLPLEGDPVATSVGNPHCTFFVEDIETYNIEIFGKAYENHLLFPNRTNVQLAQLVENNVIRVKVWERGVGATLASGSSSCAVAVAANRRGLVGKKVRVILDGGELEIFYSDNGVWMTGETSDVFEGTISEDFLLKTETSLK